MAKFHVRARTVDLLGRQQIAGIPTAISELFKNAHDAYANNVEADYYRDDGLFVIRDDGLGMTRGEFEERWLTLGTDSKLGDKGGLKPPPRDTKQKKRPVLGEKGIGRLAIAIIGPQVLILTRAKRDNKASDVITAAYINWGLFELPGVDLDQIEIPIRTFKANSLPNADDVRSLVNEAATQLDMLANRPNKALIDRIRHQITEFDVDPQDIDKYLEEPSLSGDGCGTHFFIKPADEIIEDDIDNRDGDKASRIEKHLIGFTNTMTPDFKPPPIVARFRDHPDEGDGKELIGEKAFFTPEEFQEVDHHISGRFDEYGQFKGKVGVYQTIPDSYVLNWADSDGNPTLCGPFSFSFAVLQGQASDSLVPPEEHARLARKLNIFGGLYIYRDGVRVQPYGDTNYDWLDIEFRRTKSASFYYYSYRRMCGAIELTREKNSELVEKAGREGFTENKAYRQFRSMLMSFYLQTAADFFREDGKYAEGWEETRSELQENDRIRKKKAKQSSQKKTVFEKDLDSFFETTAKQTPEIETDKVLAELQKSVDRIIKQNIKPAQKAAALMRVEKEGRDTIKEQRSALVVTRPRGVGLSKKLNNEWSAYQGEIKRIENDVLGAAENKIEEIVSSSATDAKLPLNQLSRISTAVTAKTNDAKGVITRLKRDNEGALTEFTKNARETVRSSSKAVYQTIDEVLAELEHLKKTSKDVSDVSDKRAELEKKIEDVFLLEKDRLEKLRDQFSALEEFWQKDGYGSFELAEALEEELIALRDQRDADLELAQIGLVINTINHEFEKSVGGLRDGFRRLSSWANANPDLKDLYSDMRASFDHLDGYLSLFTPLDRRLQRHAVDISGKDIFDFLSALFEARLKRHEIKFDTTAAFRKASVHGFPSTFYPVFVNLVDNAIFWLQNIRNKDKVITLDSHGDQLLVHDNGPGVSARDFENIFSLNFSRKPGGRGMGLYIARAALEKVGYNLTIDTSKRNEGTTFIISPKGKQGD